ncbi:MAG: NADH pyrophosphatase [Chloroflexi bacterium OLB14]|nr:MAG: NADH pyrophosphatase [Chloroflexi bacterium OLB14]
MNRIRVIAICIFRNENKILVAEGFDPVKNQSFYRPLGGGIEFGEKSAETVKREIMEEIKAEVTNLDYLGTIENIFVFDGNMGHEIVQVYDGEFVKAHLYQQSEILGMEDDASKFKAVWKEIESFNAGVPLYPDGLQEMLIRLK